MPSPVAVGIAARGGPDLRVHGIRGTVSTAGRVVAAPDDLRPPGKHVVIDGVDERIADDRAAGWGK